MVQNNMDELFQSAYIKPTMHITETALVKVQNDVLRALDGQQSVILYYYIRSIRGI